MCKYGTVNKLPVYANAAHNSSNEPCLKIIEINETRNKRNKRIRRFVHSGGTDDGNALWHEQQTGEKNLRSESKNPACAGFSPEKSKLTDKPGSVVDSHSSRPAIAHWLKQPTRVQYGPYHANPYLALLRVEFTVPRTVARRAVRSYRTLSPLPDPINGPSAVCSLLHWS